MAEEAEATARQCVKKDAESDLAFVWDDCKVPIQVQSRLCQAGFTSMKLFGNLADSKQDLRSALAADFGLAVEGQPQNRLKQASVLAAWESAREWMAKEISLRAEAKVLGERRPPTPQEHIAMKQAVEALYGTLREKEVPSTTYLALKMEELERDMPKAASLDEISSMEDSDEHSLTATFDASGHLRVTKQKLKMGVPTNSEELRARLRLEMNAWLFLATKFVSKVWLRDITPKVWLDFIDYILGESVMRLAATPDASGSALTPSWTLVISYEFECRKWIYRKVRDGTHTLAQSLTEVTTNSEIRTLHLVTPMSLQKRAVPPPAGQPAAKFLK
eukprot:6479159-Amphidinium_carterae.1